MAARGSLPAVRRSQLGAARRCPFPFTRTLSVRADSVAPMPSSLHEALGEMFRQRPTLAAELLTGALGIELPAHEQAHVEPGDFTDVTPTEYRADAVVVLTTAVRAPVLGVIIEIQLRRDPDKRWSWPVYLATLRARLRRPTVLLVVCVDPGVATWCATPIELGHLDTRLTPLVVGPAQVPVVSDPDHAAAVPELSVLSALAHGARPDHHDVLHALLSALDAIEPDRALLYSDLVLDACLWRRSATWRHS